MRPNPEQINVGLIGFGNVGTGVVRYFQDGGGDPYNVHLCRVAVADLSKPRAIEFSPLTIDAAEIINDPAIDIVVELMGGVDQAKNYMFDAMNHRKSVVTGNKAVLSRCTRELFDAARSRQVDLGFEASVAGGIPIISTFHRYRGDTIDRIMGIVNGTTNYILTQMEDGSEFEPALAGAQKEGYAEANHILDTGGYDSRDKLGILASLAFNTQVDPEKIACAGITDIKQVDLDFASKYGVEEGGKGYAVKLLAIARKNGDGALELQVKPTFIRREHPLASVRGAFNAIYLESEWAGVQTFTGRGAGERPTTSAVISDILHVADNLRRGITDQFPALDSPVTYADPDSINQRGYFRVNLLHEPGSGERVLHILADHGLNVEDSIQRRRFKTSLNGEPFIPDIITVETAQMRVIKQALQKIAQSDRVHGTPFFLSFEE